MDTETKASRHWEGIYPEDRANLLFLGVVDRATNLAGRLSQPDRTLSRRRFNNIGGLLNASMVTEYMEQFESHERVASHIRGSYWKLPVEIRKMVDYLFGRPNGYSRLLNKVTWLDEEYPHYSIEDDFESGE